jgi:hypothetical protein
MMADNKRKIVLVAVVVSLVIVGALVWSQRQQAQDAQQVNVPLYTLDTDFSTENVQKAEQAQEAALKKVGVEIQDRPRHYVTTIEQQADDIARQTAERERADYVVKQQDMAPAIVAPTNDSKGDDKGQQTTVYNNTYYAVHQEKKHDIKAGVAVVDDKAAAVVTYRNRELSYSVYTDGHKATGAAVQYTICKW